MSLKVVPPPLNLNAKRQNKKIVFDYDEEETPKAVVKEEDNDLGAGLVKSEDEKEVEDDDNDYFAQREKMRQQKALQKGKNQKQGDDAEKKWYNVFTQFPSSDEALDMKDSEQIELDKLCKSSFEAEKPAFLKRNPNDVRWLQTALHKGTAKDRANAGALLVTSNPLANLEALSTLISFCKLSNKACNDVVALLTDLWKDVLLPPQRKLLPLHLRAADWKLVRRDISINKETQRKIYAYWHFESELKDQYMEFLKNLEQNMRTGQEHHKNASIVAASKLLAYAPEKEQMLLTMLINKLGDPVAKVASKSLHHLGVVAHQHPNMCGVMVAETEKLLFRNNVAERAQHFALCFLASIAPVGQAEVCTKLVNICFALFKVLVQKGAVNNRTMQAILRCLQKAILDARPPKGSDEIMTKDMQDTIYRLVHLADIRISVQTLSLLLQLVAAKKDATCDRFYNALYKKMLHLDVVGLGIRSAAQLLHIIHRAIHIDGNVSRAHAFIKRLLQIALYMPAHFAAGSLIVTQKLLHFRKELRREGVAEDSVSESKAQTKINENEEKKQIEEKQVELKYDPYHRVPAYAGGVYSLRQELLLLRDHYHPSVQKFAECILLQKRIDYHGDPLRDFGLPHFLERFAFKNPKKLDKDHKEASAIPHKRYLSYGARGQSVKSLTKSNCTEEELFILNYLEQKRQKAAAFEASKKDKEQDLEEEAELLKPGEVNDDEFEEYLDGFFGKKAKAAADAEEELDFLQELSGEQATAAKNKKKTKASKAADDEDEDNADLQDDWAEDDEDDEIDDEDEDMDFDDDDADELGDDSEDDVSVDEANSVIEDERSGSEDGDESNDETMHIKRKKPAQKKRLAALDDRSFAKKLKHSADTSSLFAAAEDFAELLEETGKAKGQGTINALQNKDKASQKQLEWEEKRHSIRPTRGPGKSYGKKFKSKAGAKKSFIKKKKF